MNITFNDTYEIRSVIGRGGMSTVYLAEHKRLHTCWAVKEVREAQGARFDFLAESNILKNLDHRMLPRIVDIFEDESAVYIVEDYVKGITLQAFLDRETRVEETRGVQWFLDPCDVLDYLHRQTPHPIIYRDMKPANIMLQPDGMLKLIDFGIARTYKQESGGDTACIGTKGYAAPEQFGTAQTDTRTDIYSLGVTMYHLLTGKSPYAPPYGFVPARQLVPSFSCGMEHILFRCVQPEPEARYQSVAELVDDLNHRYRYDHVCRKYVAARRAKTALILGLLATSAALMISGRTVMGQEKEQRYVGLLSAASELYETDLDQAAALLDQARDLFPERVDADRQETYALYLNGQWQACVDHGTAALAAYGQDPQTQLTVASAQFELGEYELAAEGFSKVKDLSVDNLRDYAVCLGRLGQIDQAEQVLESLSGKGAHPDVTTYVQGEVSFARKDYLAAETAFLSALEQSRTSALTRRCYLSLGDLYRDCAALARVNESPIPHPATKSAELLSGAVVQEGLRYDSVLWEMLALAYFEAWHTDPSVPAEYAAKAADCFSRVIELGVTKEYLYSNLYTIYYELKDYDRAEQALAAYEAKFPEDYMPHALRGMLLVTVENEKPQAGRDCSAGFRSIHLHTKGTDKTPGCNRSASGRFERVGSGQNFRFFTDDFVRPSHTSDPEWESKICRAP